MEKPSRFKIDLCGSHYCPFALFVSKRTWLGWKWEEIARFDDREKARDHYELIKDLPEYLA